MVTARTCSSRARSRVIGRASAQTTRSRLARPRTVKRNPPTPALPLLALIASPNGRPPTLCPPPQPGIMTSAHRGARRTLMLREEQIDIRRQRAAQEQFKIQNLGRNRVFSDYQITNPTSGGQYRVSIRGFDVGDNTCECPDFRTNTLGTCKHIEAVLAALRDETPPQLRRRKAAVTHPEVYLQYGEQLRLGLHLPPRYSDQLRFLVELFFDPRG